MMSYFSARPFTMLIPASCHLDLEEKKRMDRAPPRDIDKFAVFLLGASQTGSYMCQGLNSHYFHIIGDGHQPNSRGLYTHCKDSY